MVDPDGIALISDEVSVSMLKEAYSLGIFPWPHENLPILWFCPEERGVLEFNELHISRSLIKDLRKHNWHITMNHCFEDVIRQCASQPRPGQEGTWITSFLIDKYIEFHKAGFAHSFECWNKNQLVGGMYGVFIEGIFSGESMFFKTPNASKACLLAAIDTLKKIGVQWIDIQMVTDHMKRFGGKDISRDQFLIKLKQSKNMSLSLPQKDKIFVQGLIKKFID